MKIKFYADPISIKPIIATTFEECYEAHAKLTRALNEIESGYITWSKEVFKKCFSPYDKNNDIYQSETEYEFECFLIWARENDMIYYYFIE